MHPLTCGRLALATACLLGLTMAGLAPAADEKADTQAIDAYVYSSLRYVINHGVDLYNGGDIEGCYQHFRRALETVAPVLAHRPELQKSIRASLGDVDKDAAWRARAAGRVKVRFPDGIERSALAEPEHAPLIVQKAFALRAVLNDVRASVASPEEKAPVQANTLWARLGGDRGVAAVVDDFIATAGNDPKVNMTRGGRYILDTAALADLKKGLIDMISQASGGPRRYTGPSMKEVHKGMRISNAEFDAAADHFRQALEKHAVAGADQKTLLDAIEKTRADIVEPAKPDDTKPKDTKPAAAGTVTGTITLKGKPLAGAMVTFLGTDEVAVTAATDENGAFMLKGLAQGSYQVVIVSAKKPEKPGVIVAIPQKYADVKTSGLKVEVRGEKSQIDLRLD